MDFLRKAPKVANHAAALTVFLAGYLTASIMTLFAFGLAEDILTRTTIVLLVTLMYMTLVFLVARIIRRTDVVDIAWGEAFIVVVLVSFLMNGYDLTLGANVQTLVSALVVLWGVRLSWHMVRRVMSRPEDKRYVALRKKWKGNEALNTYLRIFVLQGVLVVAVGIAIVHVNLSPVEPLGWTAAAGALVWLIGFLFESIGDAQLKRHLNDPKKKHMLMTTGLWRYTRHPNYFGEATQWWGIALIGWMTPFGWVGILSPVLITYLLLFVSGVPITEKAFEGREGWTTYKKRTSMFLPLPPKKR